MARQVVLANVEIVISVQLPEFAVDNVEVLVAEVLRNLIDVLLLLQQLQHLEEVRLSQLRQTDRPRPGSVEAVEDAGNDGVHVPRVELLRLFQEQKARVGVHDVLNEALQVLGQEVGAATLRGDGHKASGVVVAGGDQPENETEV